MTIVNSGLKRLKRPNEPKTIIFILTPSYYVLRGVTRGRCSFTYRLTIQRNTPPMELHVLSLMQSCITSFSHWANVNKPIHF